MSMKTIKNKLSEKLRQYVASPQPDTEKAKLTDWEDYVLPMEGDTVHVSENIDNILYGKER